MLRVVTVKVADTIGHVSVTFPTKILLYWTVVCCGGLEETNKCEYTGFADHNMQQTEEHKTVYRCKDEATTHYNLHSTRSVSLLLHDRFTAHNGRSGEWLRVANHLGHTGAHLCWCLSCVACVTGSDVGFRL